MSPGAQRPAPKVQRFWRYNDGRSIGPKARKLSANSVAATNGRCADGKAPTLWLIGAL